MALRFNTFTPDSNRVYNNRSRCTGIQRCPRVSCAGIVIVLKHHRIIGMAMVTLTLSRSPAAMHSRMQSRAIEVERGNSHASNSVSFASSHLDVPYVVTADAHVDAA